MKRRHGYGFLAGMVALAVGAVSPRVATAGDTVEPVANAAPAPRFSGTNVTHVSAVVFDVDAAHNSVTLVEEHGEPFDVAVDRSLGNVRQLRPGDTVDITFSRALLLRADKSDASGIRRRVDKEVTTAASRGSSLSMHRVEATTTVVQIERGRHQLTLRGPTRTVTLQANSDKLLDGLRVGDSVRVDYVEATAVRILRNGVPLR